ncbi:hypothetical protein D3C85_1636240 [compost metagenome]
MLSPLLLVYTVKLVPSNLFRPSLVPNQTNPLWSCRIVFTVFEERPFLVLRVMKLGLFCPLTILQVSDHIATKEIATLLDNLFNIITYIRALVALLQLYWCSNRITQLGTPMVYIDFV